MPPLATASSNTARRTAQWKADLAARRPKPAKLAEHPQLREYVQDKLSGVIRDDDGKWWDRSRRGKAATNRGEWTAGGQPPGARSRSPTGCPSTSPTMSRCGSPTKRGDF
jgi:hypothetical protein